MRFQCPLDVMLGTATWPPPKQPYLTKTDGIREEFWLKKIESAVNNMKTLLVCGSRHVNFVAEKAEARGHILVDKRFFPEELQFLQFEVVNE